jgi:hypothetical protein
MTMAALMMHSLATQAAHVAEVNPGAAAATGFVRYFDYPGPLNVSPAPAAPATPFSGDGFG